MHTKTESVTTVYQGLRAVALVKRDEASHKNIVYVLKEASVEEITSLIATEIHGETIPAQEQAVTRN